MNIWSRSVLTVSRIGSSIRADAAVKKVYTATIQSVRTMMSRLMRKNFRTGSQSTTSRHVNRVRILRYRRISKEDSQQNSRILGHDRAVGDARDAHAVSNTSHRLVETCTIFTVTAIHIGITAFCMPVYQPLNPKSMIPAGTAQMRA